MKKIVIKHDVIVENRIYKKGERGYGDVTQQDLAILIAGGHAEVIDSIPAPSQDESNVIEAAADEGQADIPTEQSASLAEIIDSIPAPSQDGSNVIEAAAEDDKSLFSLKGKKKKI